MTDFEVVGITALVVATVSPFGLIPMLERASMVDVPNARSSHTHQALRGGGMAPCLGAAAALATAILTTPRTTSELLWPVLITLLVTATIGWVEDVWGISVVARAGAQTMTGAWVVCACAVVWDKPWWWLMLGGIAMVGLVNVANFMDGVNGMSAAHGVVAGTAFAVIGARHDADWATVSGVVLAAAFLGFFPWNYNGRIFLGDIGSYLLGGTSAIIVVLGWMHGLPIIALAAPFAIYVADTSVTLLGRVLARERWYEAHRDHTYQRLNRLGLSHLRVTALVATASASCAALGIAVSETSGILRVGSFCAMSLIVTAYTVVRFGLASVNDER